MTIKSEAFKKTYAIFINPKAAPVYKKIIKRNNLENVDIFKAVFDENLAMITIPHNNKTKEIETLLFEQSSEKEKNGEFWGQVGVGYKGKIWEKYD